MTFYLGAPEPCWLRETAVPLMLSHRRLRRIRKLPRARGPWILDSGAFSEIDAHGKWVTTAQEYADCAAHYASTIGTPVAAAVQDWMCEPHMLQKTGLTTDHHQEKTLQSLLELSELAPHIPWMPTLQGWEPADYLRHAALYDAAGVDLAGAPLVGLGSVCKRQQTAALCAVVAQLPLELRLHGFGVKQTGLAAAAHRFTSADSMAWSTHARRRPPLPGCTHKSCANCLKYALQWRSRTLANIESRRPSPHQTALNF